MADDFGGAEGALAPRARRTMAGAMGGAMLAKPAAQTPLSEALDRIIPWVRHQVELGAI